MVSLEKVKLALNNLNNITLSTPLELIDSYSNLFSSNVYVKREDLQITRSFKIRGSFNKILSLSEKAKRKWNCMFKRRKSCARCIISLVIN